MKTAHKIGSLKLKNQFLLAPMAEVNDIAFRLLCKKAGAALVYTGMINPLNKKELDLEDKPALQLFSTDEKGIREFIKRYDSKVSLFDFNLGCPARKAKECGYGVFLQNDFKAIEGILKAMRESTKKPITIKLRKSKNVLKIIKIAEKYCDAIAIHPRTQEQGYSGTPDLKFAESIKKKTKLPIIYSGDVNEENACKLLEKFDFLMIGRAAIGNPGIFARLSKDNSNNKTPVKLINKASGSIRAQHIMSAKQENSRAEGEAFGFLDYVNLTKKHSKYFRQVKFQAMAFTKAKENAKEMRREIMQAKNLKDIEEIYKKFG
jgi:tRNA-dihydrouridine synthase B